MPSTTAYCEISDVRRVMGDGGIAYVADRDNGGDGHASDAEQATYIQRAIDDAATEMDGLLRSRWNDLAALKAAADPELRSINVAIAIVYACRIGGGNISELNAIEADNARRRLAEIASGKRLISVLAPSETDDTRRRSFGRPMAARIGRP